MLFDAKFMSHSSKLLLQNAKNIRKQICGMVISIRHASMLQNYICTLQGQTKQSHADALILKMPFARSNKSLQCRCHNVKYELRKVKQSLPYRYPNTKYAVLFDPV